MPNYISEDQIEKEILKRLKEKHNYQTLNCYTRDPNELNDKSDRISKTDVVFSKLLKEKLIEFNKDVPIDTINSAVEQLTQKLFSLSPVLANKKVYEFIKEGIPVEYDNQNGERENKRLTLIDFNTPHNNSFLAVSQLWIKGEHYFRRPDIIIYITFIRKF